MSTGIWSSPKAASSTTPAVFCPTPGRAINSFRVEGTRVHSMRVGGQYVDEYYMAKLL